MALALIAYLRCRGEQPPDLGGEHELVPIRPTQHIANAPLAESEPVVRRGIEIPHAGGPGALEGGLRFPIGHGPVQIPQRRSSKPELTDTQPGASERARWNFVDSAHTEGDSACARAS